MTLVSQLLADLTSKDEYRAETAARLLAEHGEMVLPAMADLLRSSNVDDRWWAVRTLAQMQRPDPEWLRSALGDSSPEVRAGAALALSTHPDPLAGPALVDCLNDDDGVTAVLAVGALTAIGRAAVPALIEAFGGATPRARIHIMRAVAQIRDPRAINLMMQAMAQDSAALQYWAQRGLEMLGLDMVYLKPE